MTGRYEEKEALDISSRLDNIGKDVNSKASQEKEETEKTDSGDANNESKEKSQEKKLGMALCESRVLKTGFVLSSHFSLSFENTLLVTDIVIII